MGNQSTINNDCGSIYIHYIVILLTEKLVKIVLVIGKVLFTNFFMFFLAVSCKTKLETEVSFNRDSKQAGVLLFENIVDLCYSPLVVVVVLVTVTRVVIRLPYLARAGGLLKEKSSHKFISIYV